MKFTDDPTADQIANDRDKFKQRHNLEAFVRLEDILYDCGPIELAGVSIDAVIDVVVVQVGTGRLDIEKLVVKNNTLFLEDAETLASLGKHFFDPKLMPNFQAKIDQIALELAARTPESEWEYRSSK